MELIDGNQIASTIIAELKAEVATITGRKPCIALVRVGDDPASVSYARQPERAAAESGSGGRVILPPVDIAQADLEKIIDDLNTDDTVDGMLVQSPMPKQIDELLIFRRISPAKDVDGLGTM